MICCCAWPANLYLLYVFGAHLLCQVSIAQLISVSRPKKCVLRALLNIRKLGYVIVTGSYHRKPWYSDMRYLMYSTASLIFHCG